MSFKSPPHCRSEKVLTRNDTVKTVKMDRDHTKFNQFMMIALTNICSQE